jgi:N-acetylglucosamine kinase-like BadF-type ATPase
MKYVLGFDGGGTKTECVLMDLTGAVVARGRGPASNPTRIGFESAAEGVKRAAAITLANHPANVTALCAGLAGTAREENHAAMQRLLEERFPGVAVEVRTDLDLALAAMPEGPAIVLVAGTGSAAVGRDRTGRQAREGGYGPAGSDEGSAFDIGRGAVAAARLDPASPAASELSRQILRHLGQPDWREVDRRIAVQPDEVFPRIFPVVAASADAGNAAAQGILQSAAAALSAIALRLAEALELTGRPFALGKTGGMVGRSPFFDQRIDGELRQKLPTAVMAAVSEEPARTAARIALGLLERREG